jgi:protein TonB
MPRDLFTTPGVSRSSGPRGRLVPVSVALHVVVVGAVVIAPLFAVGPLPPPHSPLAYRVTEIVLPKLPPPATGIRRGTAASSTPAVAQPAPTVAPDSLPAVDVGSAGPVLDPAAASGDGVGVNPGVPGGFDSFGAVQAPAAPPAATPRMRVGGQIRAPQKIHDVPPVYPAIAQQARVEGLVILDAVIGPDGRVRNVRVLRSVPLLDRAAVDAVRQWVFSPTLLNGTPVEVAMTITVQFRLSR